MIAYRRDAGISAVILAAILILVFSPFLIGHESLMASAGDVPSLYVDGAIPGHPTGHYRGLDQGAAGWMTEPAFAAAHRVMFGEHRLPFWDADGAYGKPSLGAMVPQEFYPLSTLVDLHPTPRMEAWWIVARLFVAGLFAALFVRLFFASRLAAISAGISAMFTGYFLLYYDMPHLSVEVEIPMLLWATEIVSRKPSARRIAALAGAVALAVLGGMPESALLALSLSALYAVLRLVTVPGDRRTRIAALGGSYVLGAAIGSIELVPFLELLVHGASDHDPSAHQGLAYDGFWANGLLTELFPRAFGNPFESILQNGAGFSGTRGFAGMAAALLAGVGVASAWIKRDQRTAVATFFAIVATSLVLKRFGNPLVNWTGGLPLFVQVQFQKYGEAEIGCVTAILVGFGIGYLRERRGDARALWISFAAVVSLATVTYLDTRAEIASTFAMHDYPSAIALGLIFLFVTAAAAASIVMDRQDRGLRLLGSVTILAVLIAEPFVAYLYPAVFRAAPPIGQNPYAGAPYISYLEAHTVATHERLFGIGGILYPNWASAYGLVDTRSLEAVSVREYLPFVDAFVATTPALSDDQYDRFTGARPIDMNAPLVRRWLSLSSVGYVLAPPTVRLPYPLVYHDPGVNIFRVSNSLPRLVLYHRLASAPSFKQALTALTSPSFDVYHNAVVEGPLPAAAAATGNDHVTITESRSDRVEAMVDAGSAGMLMQNDTWYPGWRATVDGHVVPIVRTDALFRGIPISAGRHDVVISYASVTALLGTLLSLIGTLLLIVLLVDPRARTHRRIEAE